MREQDSTWADTRSRFVERYGGQTPSLDVDQEASAAFVAHPAALVALLDELADAWTAGKIHSPWRVLAKRLPQLERDHRAVAVDRDKEIHRAETWILNAGVHFDVETELLDELFGAHGMLKAWADDDVLRQRMLTSWRAERPRGEQCEQERIERAERYKAARARKT